MTATKMRKKTDAYIDLDGNKIDFASLDAEERRVVARLRRRAAAKPGWSEFRNFAINAVGAFYDARDVPRSKSKNSVLLHIALDLASRLGIAEGNIRPDDYRDELDELIRGHFPSQTAFCEATGISVAMLSHVLAGRKDFSLGSLSKALERIGYRLRFVPTRAKHTG